MGWGLMAGATKVCTGCRVAKPLDSFPIMTQRGRAVRRARCATCLAKYSKQWKLDNPDQALDTYLRKKYGISLDGYRTLLEVQNGVCAICKQSPAERNLSEPKRGRQTVPRLVVDHCHATGRIRGLLCIPCNRGIGFLNDDPALLLAAIDFLERG